MAHSTPRLQNRRPYGQGPARNQFNWMECDALHWEIRRLNDLLSEEKNSRIQLGKELEDTKKQLAKQKSLKEMYINKEKETRRELERLQKYCDAETLCTSNIATQVRSNIKRKQKKLLQKDYEELQVAHVISQERFATELQVEKEKSKVLQEELEKMSASYHEVTLRYEAEVLPVRQQADNLQRELEEKNKSHADKVAQDLYLIHTLRAEQDTLCQKMTKEIENLQQNNDQTVRHFQRQLMELKSQINVQTSLNIKLSAALEGEREDNEPPRRKITRHKEKPVEEAAEKPVDQPEEEAEEMREDEQCNQEESSL